MNIIKMKKFSIGSKRPDAKQININLNPKHLKFGVAFFVLALLFHMFVYSPYLKTELISVCGNETQVIIEDNMSTVCDTIIPFNMTKEEIFDYLIREQNKELDYNFEDYLNE